MSPRLSFVAVLLALPFAIGCSGLAASNVGEPTLQARLDFQHGLARLTVGMPVDSLEMIFQDVKKPGEAGILRRATIITEDRERVSYRLGWLSDPRHQIGHKEIEEIEVTRATVIVEQGRIHRIDRRD